VSYVHNKRWRLAHPERRNSSKRAYYRRFAGGRNNYSPWTSEELEAITAAHRPVDRVLSRKLGRSILAIQHRRAVVKRGGHY
jgi:hypothetical protein